MKPKYCIKWLRKDSDVIRISYFHTNFITKFTAKLRAMSKITVLSIHKA